jgi:hypothetical protein
MKYYSGIKKKEQLNYKKTLKNLSILLSKIRQYVFHYIIFWKRQNYRDSKQIKEVIKKGERRLKK